MADRPDRFTAVDDLPEVTDDELQRAIQDSAGGIVYFLQHGDRGPVKIGYTTEGHLAGRMSAMQTGNPVTLHLRRTSPGTRKTERLLHRFFADLHVKGEWFWASPQLCEVAWANPSPAP